MIKFLCKKDCKEFPQTKKGNIYYGVYDKDGQIWILDDWWIEQGVTKESFEIECDGSYVENKNQKYFEVI